MNAREHRPTYRHRSAYEARAALALVVAALTPSCTGIDDTLLRGPDASRGSASTVDGGDLDGGAGGLDGGGGPTRVDAGGFAGQGGGGAGDAGGEMSGDGGATAGCRRNPDVSDEVCTEICVETCNGNDDDCDLRVDEETDGSCPAAHGTAVCAQGACVVVSCDGDFRDCDGVASNGCEVSITDDPRHCGACGNACVLDHVTLAACDQGLACVVGTCEDGYDDCDADDATGCETSLRTLADCGGCASQDAAELCTGLPHAAISDCSTGTCAITECIDDWQDCDLDAANGCERRASVVGPCTPDDDCDRFTRDGSDYYLCRNARTWEEARANCRLILRGELVAVEDDAEDAFVQSLAEGPAWIGANDLSHPGLWAWSRNGVPFWRGDAEGSAVEGRYAAWASGAPAAGLHCAAVTETGNGWFDADCSTPQGYVCEVIPDRCPGDPLKSEAGQCDCGTPDDDFDDDGIAFCDDACTSDPMKTTAGACGCGTPDIDSDADGTADCVDGCPGDVSKTAAGACGCGTPDDDSDSDGARDCNDGCDADPDKTAPGRCGCGRADTDSDSDGTADCDDLCPDDPAKTVPGVCGCDVTETDTDGDGTPNCSDQCPLDSAKTVPAICGCGLSEADTDGDGTKNCLDGCPGDPNKVAPQVCGCGIPETDADGNGMPDCDAQCPDDPLKDAPGVCGCGTPDTDSDGDGFEDCIDECFGDPDKQDAGICGCGVADSDSDSDASVDCIEECDLDPSKTLMGVCGCGVPETDTDFDGFADCIDPCFADPSKQDMGACGCGTPDTDSDGDGTADCADLCPNDAGKTSAGACGCGVADTDTDSDATADCTDLCDNDPAKTMPGTCGCGTPDVDSDDDGTLDCNDGCDGDATKTAPGQCGCGNPDTDADSDGSADCIDECDADPDKSTIGLCGCGVADTNTDGDSEPDCTDDCDEDPAKIVDTDTDDDGAPDCVDGCDLDRGRTELGTCGCIAEPSPAPLGTPCSDGLHCPLQIACDGAGSCGLPGDCGPTGGTCTRTSYTGMASEGYWRCTDERTWSDARVACQSDGMELAHVNDAVEDAAIAGWVQSTGAAAWLGANDPAANQRWVWADDDTLFSVGATAQSGNYTSWSGGEPNGGAGGCLELTTTGGWSDLSCATLHDYVCEIPKLPDPKRKKLTIAGDDAIGAVGAQTDFPVLVRISDGDLAVNAFPSGRDIHFEDATGHTLAFERERYDSGTGTLVAWVELDLTGENQDFYLYYGDGDLTEKSTPTGVWDASYDGVWHLESVGTLTDSAGTYAGTNVGSTNVAGVIGQAADFATTTTQYIALPSAALSGITGASSTSRKVSFSFWAESDATTQQQSVFGADENVHATDLGSRIFNLHFPYSNGVIYWDADTETGFNRLEQAGGGAASPPWSHWAVTMNNATGEQRIYRNGAIWAGPATDSNFLLDRVAGRFTLGAERPALNRWDGRVDEFRVSRSERSASWLRTEYNNQRPGSTFLSLGSEEDTTSPSSYVQTVTLDNMAGPVLSNHQVPLVIDASDADFWNKLASTDGRDLRVTTTGGTDLDFFIEKLDTGAREAVIWVEVPSAVAGGTGSYELHYGDPSLGSVSDGQTTFAFFDDFDDGALDAGKWTTINPSAATFVESGGVLTITGVGCCGDWWSTSESAGYLVSTNPITGDYVYETWVTNVSQGAHNRSLGLRSGSATNEKMYVLKCDGDCSHVTTAWRDTVGGVAAEAAENSGVPFPGDNLLATFIVSGNSANTYYGDGRAGARTTSSWGLDHVALSDTVHAESCSYDWTRVRKYAAVSGLPSDCSLARDHDGHRYVHCTNGRSWTAARDMCAAAGGYLVQIDDAAENAFVDGLNASTSDCWIGANDRGAEAAFMWARATDSAGGTLCNGNNPCTAVGGAYTNWEPGQPNNANNAEDCVRMAASGGKWWDLDCAVATPQAVCELAGPSLALDGDEVAVRPASP